MKCFYINLNNATNRKKCIEENFSIYKEEGWKLTRFPAIDTNYVKEHNIQGSLSPEEKACFISHKELIKSQLNYDEHLFIFEDDATIGKNTCCVIETFIKEMNETNIEWDILYTDVTVSFASNASMIVEHRKNFELSNELKIFDLGDFAFAGATAYIVNKKSKRKIYDLLETEKIMNIPYDVYLRFLSCSPESHTVVSEKRFENCKYEQIKQYVIFPFPTSLSEFSTDSQLRDNHFGEFVFCTFRKMLWIDRNLTNTKFLLDEINEILINIPYEQNASFLNYAYQINKLLTYEVYKSGVDYGSAKEWTDNIKNDLTPKLSIPFSIKLEK